MNPFETLKQSFEQLLVGSQAEKLQVIGNTSRATWDTRRTLRLALN